MEAEETLTLLNMARNIASEAARMARHYRDNGVNVAKTKSNALDIVTQADPEVERLIHKRILAERPHDGFFGEETGADQSTSEITWIVDPIDGTVNYLYGSPYYAVSIAAAITTPDGTFEPIVGVVNAPQFGVEYAASSLTPATCNGIRLHVNEETTLDRALISTGIPYDLEARKRVLADINTLTPQIRDFRIVGAASLEIIGVAEGRTDAHIQRRLPAWDFSAGILIAKQAGATIRIQPGDNHSAQRIIIASTSELADAIENQID